VEENKMLWPISSSKLAISLAGVEGEDYKTALMIPILGEQYCTSMNVLCQAEQ
jgi:hypothetical protein